MIDVRKLERWYRGYSVDDYSRSVPKITKLSAADWLRSLGFPEISKDAQEANIDYNLENLNNDN